MCSKQITIKFPVCRVNQHFLAVFNALDKLANNCFGKMFKYRNPIAFRD